MNKTSDYNFTEEGFENLKKELDTLEARRPQVVINLSNAREQGDLSENAGYHAAKDELSQIDSRVRELKYLLRVGKVQKTNGDGAISFGVTVKLHNGSHEQTFTIVEELEANPSLGKISTSSPIGSALLGKKQGEEITVEMPGGKTVYKILEIS